MNESLKTSERFPIGSRWRNKRSGIVAEVVGIERDCLKLARPGMRQTLKWIDHFVRQYVEAEKPIPLTRKKLDELIDAYTGALQHADYAGAKLSHAEHDRVIEAVQEARTAILKAVFP